MLKQWKGKKSKVSEFFLDCLFTRPFVTWVQQIKTEMESCWEQWPLQVTWWSFLFRSSTGRALTGSQQGGLWVSQGCCISLSLSLRRRGASAWRCHWSAYDPALPSCNHQSHVRKVLFQIGRPVPPAASGANSTGRITGAAANLWECGLYKHRKKKNVKKKQKKINTHTLWWKPQSEGSLRFLEHRLNNELSVSDTHRGHTWWDCRGRRRELFFLSSESDLCLRTSWLTVFLSRLPGWVTHAVVNGDWTMTSTSCRPREPGVTWSELPAASYGTRKLKKQKQNQPVRRLYTS